MPEEKENQPGRKTDFKVSTFSQSSRSISAQRWKKNFDNRGSFSLENTWTRLTRNPFCFHKIMQEVISCCMKLYLVWWLVAVIKAFSAIGMKFMKEKWIVVKYFVVKFKNYANKLTWERNILEKYCWNLESFRFECIFGPLSNKATNYNLSNK